MTDAPPINALGPWGDLGVRSVLAGGARNRAWLCEGEGALWVLKTTARDEASLDWVDRVQEIAAGVGVISPRLRRTRAGALSAGGFTLEPFIVGTHPAPRDLPRLLSARISALHDATPDWPDRPGVPGTAALVPPGDIDADIAAWLLAAVAALPATPRSAVHGDLNASNVIVRPDGVPVLIDWDEARRDDPGLDLAVLFESTDDPQGAALIAREIITGWTTERDYALKLIESVRSSGALGNVF